MSETILERRICELETRLEDLGRSSVAMDLELEGSLHTLIELIDIVAELRLLHELLQIAAEARRLAMSQTPTAMH
jgi:hypothetical protein